MPAYQFYRLGPGQEEVPPVQIVLFADEAALRVALSARFPGGCDVWQGSRFVGQFHPAHSRHSPVDSPDTAL
jgi:hypothetical protein